MRAVYVSRAVLLIHVLFAVSWALPVEAQPTSPVSDPTPVEVVYPPWFKVSLLDLPADLNDAREAGRKGLMLFYSTRTCSYCKAFLETTFARPDIVERTRAQFDVIGLEVISDEEVIDFQGRSRWLKDFAVQERARFTPTLAFHGEDGRLLLRMVGYVGPERFSDALDYLEAAAYEHQELRAFLDQRQAVTGAVALRPVIRDAGLFNAAPVALNEPRLSGVPTLVLFEHPDCTACERLHRTVLTVDSVRALVSRFRAVQLDMTDDHTTVVTPGGGTITPRNWARHLGLIHAPALVFFDERGVEAVRADSDLLIDPQGNAVDQVNARIIRNFEARLHYVLEKGYEDQPQFQRWRAARFREGGAEQ